MSETTIAPMQRAGFWRRCFSLLIDGAIIAILFQLVGTILYGVTGGAIQSTGSFAGVPSCIESGMGETRSTPKETDKDKNIVSSVKKVCTYSLFGVPQLRWIRETETRSFDGKMKIWTTKNQPIDAKNNDAHELDLGLLSWPAFLVWRIFVESRGDRTIGRRLLKNRLVSHDGSTPSFSRVAKRYAYREAPALVMFIAIDSLFTATISDILQGENPTYSMLLLLVLSALHILITIWITVDIVRRRDTYYDRLAETCVVDDPT